jgi:hypothetical protein
MVGQFFRTTVTAQIVVGASSFSVADASGFPVPTGDKFFYLTLVNENDFAEVVRIANVTGLTLTLVEGDGVQNGFAATTTRAELWFTADAFEDMQDYILALNAGTGGGYEPDGVTIIKNGLNELEIKDGAVLGDGVSTAKINDGAITELKLANNSVSNIKVQSGIDAVKLIGENRTVVQDSVERTGLPNTAGLTLLHIAYEEVSSAPTSGGSDGDIAIEWEALP